MFKRILKILGICLAGFVVVAGGATGIFALTGGFKNEVIHIEKLYFGDNTQDTIMTKYTLEDFVANINFEPKNATDKELQVVVQDEVGVLANPPRTITAGKDFNLKINKDDKGNNVGGVATLTVKKGIAEVKIKVVVDVAVPNNSLYFSSKGGLNDRYTIGGKSFTMGLSQNSEDIYLKSNLVNAFKLQNGEVNLKSVSIGYVYYDNAGNRIDDKTYVDSELSIEPVYNQVTNRYNYYYKIPIVPNRSGIINIQAKMHRTCEIQNEYNDNEFDNIEALITNMQTHSSNSEIRARAYAQLEKYNDFINKYIKYFDTDEAYDFFRNYVGTDGKVHLQFNDVAKSKQYVFLTTEAFINVTSVNLTDLKAKESSRSYMVFDSVNYSIGSKPSVSAEDIINTFGLEIDIENSTVTGIAEIEKNNLFKSLAITPYVYVSEEALRLDAEEGGDKVWSSYDELFRQPVYGFDAENNNLPILTNVNSSDPIGYLFDMSDFDTQNGANYISIKYNQDGYWNIKFNAPFKDNPEEKDQYTSLYLGFSVKGVRFSASGDAIEIIKHAYTRIFIDYKDYSYNDGESKLSFQGLKSKMTINNSLAKIDAEYCESLSTQPISINTDIITNYNQVQYKSVMYFVEEESNNDRDNQSKKVISVGKYNFIKIDGRECEKTPGVPLIGERIPTYDVNGRCCIETLNASTTPVKVFAVVYLSDRNGNPIDLYGRKIVINERADNDAQNNKLYVIETSNINVNMASITIDSFVDNLNYYTTIGESQTVANVAFEGGEENYIKRNNFNFYRDDDGNEIKGQDKTELENFLRLKLLKDKVFEFYITNFDLCSMEEDVTNKFVELSAYDETGKLVTDTFAFRKNTKANKQLALNTMCNGDFASNYTLFYEGGAIGLAANGISIVKEGDDVLYIKCEIVANQYGSGVIKLIAEDSTIDQPYSTRLGDPNYFNFVTYEVSVLQVTDVDVVCENEKLHVKHEEWDSSLAQPPLRFTMQQVELAGPNGVTIESHNYKLQLTEGNDIAYIVKNNLIDFSKNDDEKLNRNLIDISQRDIDSITEYVNYYTKGSINSAVSYTKPVQVAILEEDLVFSTTQDNPNELYVGSKKFAINVNMVNINGQEYVLTNEGTQHSLTLPKGSYYPIINKKINNVDSLVALILNEEFVISLDTEENTVITSFNINGNQMGARVRVSVTSTININGELKNIANYISDYEHNNSCVNKVGDEAVINFQYGEELKSYQEDANGIYGYKDGNYQRLSELSEYTGRKFSFMSIFVPDPNGEYIFHEDSNGRYVYNGNKGEYLSDPEKIAERFSKKGVTVFLLVHFQLVKSGTEVGVYEKDIYKVFTYEIVHEDMGVIGYNKAGVNTDSQRCEIPAGEISKITIGGTGAYGDSEYGSIKTTTAIDVESYNYLTFTFANDSLLSFTDAAGTENSKTKSHLSNANTLYIKTPTLLTPYDTYMEITYNNKGVNHTVKYYFTVKPNASFVPSETVHGVTTDNGDYKLTLNKVEMPEGGFDLASYFTLGERMNVAFSVDSSGCQYYQITDDNKLIINNAYAEKYSTGVDRDVIVCSINLTLNGNPITYNKKLRITIEPEYVLDMTSVNDNAYNLTINNNESIFGNDGIKLYSSVDFIPSNLVTSISAYTGAFTLVEIKEEGNTWVAKDSSTYNKDTGQIELSGGAPNEDTTLHFWLKYNNIGTNGSSVTLNKAGNNIIFNITIKGVETFYSQAGIIAEYNLGCEHDEIFNLDGIIAIVRETTINYNAPLTSINIDLNKHFAVFEKSNTYQLYYVVTQIGSPSTIATTITETGTYELYFATYNGATSSYSIISSLGINLNVNIINMLYSASGSIENQSYSDITTITDIQVLSNASTLEISKDASSIDLCKYFAVFCGTDNTYYYVVAQVGSPSTIATTIEETGTYELYYATFDSVQNQYTIVQSTGLSVNITE